VQFARAVNCFVRADRFSLKSINIIDVIAVLVVLSWKSNTFHENPMAQHIRVVRRGRGRGGGRGRQHRSRQILTLVVAETIAASSGVGYMTMNAREFLQTANPDLPERFRRGTPLNEPDRATFYGGGEAGYADYPFLKPELSAAT